MHSMIALALILTTVGTGTEILQKVDPRREPATLIAEAIRLLERKDYTTFITTCARPDELKEMLANKKLEDIAQEFARKKAPDLLVVLKEAARTKATLNADGTRADYRSR